MNSGDSLLVRDASLLIRSALDVIVFFVRPIDYFPKMPGLAQGMQPSLC
jgi:hypothetical protein